MLPMYAALLQRLPPVLPHPGLEPLSSNTALLQVAGQRTSDCAHMARLGRTTEFVVPIRGGTASVLACFEESLPHTRCSPCHGPAYTRPNALPARAQAYAGERSQRGTGAPRRTHLKFYHCKTVLADKLHSVARLLGRGRLLSSAFISVAS